MDVELGWLEDIAQGIRRLKTIHSSWQLYEAATEDDVQKLGDLLNQVSAENGVSKPAILCQLRPQGNTMLHTAVRVGWKSNVKLLLEYYPSLLWIRNWKGDTALHVAARYGRKEIAEVLIDFERHATGGGHFVRKYTRGYLLERLANESEISWELLLKMLENQVIKSSFETLLLKEEIGKEDISIEEASAMAYKHVPKKNHFEFSDQMRKLEDLVAGLLNESREPLAMLQNYKGDTGLHVALAELKNAMSNKKKNKELISSLELVLNVLVGLNSEVWFLLNNEMKSPLYLAVEAEFEAAVDRMLSDPVGIHKFEKWRHGLSPIEAAIFSGNEGILKKLLEKEPRLIHLRHEEEELDSRFRGVRSALHLAAICGYAKVVDILLEFNPFAAMTRSSDGSFPIHVASRIGDLAIFKKLLPYCHDLSAMTENQGRNILHVAAKSGSFRIVRYILKRKELGILVNQMDDEGNTPLHLASKPCRPETVEALAQCSATDLNAVNKEGLTPLVAIECSEDIPLLPKLMLRGLLISRGALQTQAMQTWMIPKVERYKDRVNTLLLVATLVATVTFAAGFTLPGGYNSSAPNQGMAILTKNNKLQAFVLCDTIAMYSSIIVAVTLIWAQLGDAFLANNAVGLAITILGISLMTMSSAFMVGISLVVGNLSWLVNAVMVIGLVFQVLQALLFLPLLLPISWTCVRIYFRIYWLFGLLLRFCFVTEKWQPHWTNSLSAPEN